MRSPASCTSSSSARPPFRRPTEAQTLWAHMHDEPAASGYDALDPVLRSGARQGAGGSLRRTAPRSSTQREQRLVSGRRRARSERSASRRAAPPGCRRCAARRGGDRRHPRAHRRSWSRPRGGPELRSASSIRSRSSVTAVAPVGNAPTEVAASDDWVWVLNANDGTGTISRLDAQTRQRVSTFSVGGTPRNIVAAFDSLWVGTTRRPRLPGGAQLGSRGIELDTSECRRGRRVLRRSGRGLADRGLWRRLGRKQPCHLAHRSGNRATFGRPRARHGAR